MKKIVFLISIAFLFCTVSHAQTEPSITFDNDSGNYIIRYQVENEIVEIIYEPPTKVKPHISAEVILSDDLTFIYSYTVQNDEGAEQRLFSIGVEHHSSITEITVPNDEWSVGKFTWAPIVDWAHTLAAPSGVGTPRTGIAPSSSENGYSFKSSGFPTIVTSYSEGEVKPLVFPQEPPLEIDELLRPISEWPNNTVQEKTIGPKDPPEPFILENFLDTLTNYQIQSCELGWIPNPGICRSLQANLDNVKRQLEQGRTQTAANNLEAFLSEVEAIREQHLSPEAYALLRYNGEYLLGKIMED